MIAAAVSVLLLLVASCTASPELHEEYECGGSQDGNFFSYEEQYERYGDISKVEIWASDFIDAVRFTHGDASEGPKLGGSGGVLVANIILDEGDYIYGVDIEKEPFGEGESICRITLVTSVGPYGPYGDCRHDGTCGERTFPYPLQYISLTYGYNIYEMTFNY